jgi:hypothetical protein
MHYKKRAEIKAQLLNGEGKDAIPIQGSAVEDELDHKMGDMDKYDARKKFRKPRPLVGWGKPTLNAWQGFSYLHLSKTISNQGKCRTIDLAERIGTVLFWLR